MAKLHPALDRRSLELESRAAVVERWLERNKLFVIALLSIVYFASTILRARGKAFWFDEILTLLPAQQSSIRGVVEGARAIEFGSPGATLVGYLVNKVAGSGEIVFRIPAMIGFWIFCLCLFGFAARRVSIFFALSAMLLPFATFGEAYSLEARSYPIVLGCCGLALFCWQSAALGKKRGLSLLGLALATGAAILFNYYAVFILLPLGGAEAVRSLKERQIDWPIWASFVAGGAALSFLPLYGRGLRIAHPWSLAQTHEYLTFYTNAFSRSLWFFVPLIVFVGAWLVLGGDREQPSSIRLPAIFSSELTAATLLLLIPVAEITVALVVPPHTFTDRYALPAIGGFALLASFLAARLAEGRSSLGLAFATAALLPFALTITRGHPLKNPLSERPMLTEALGAGPVVIPDSLTYLQTWYYAPEEIRPRLILLADEHLWLKYAHITQDMGGFRRFGVPMLSYQELALSGKPFRLYLNSGFGSWLPRMVLDSGGRLEVLKWEEGQELLLVHPN